MTFVEASKLFELLGIPAGQYAVGDEGIGENWSGLRQPDGSWRICYFERGEKTIEQSFRYESDAAAQFVANVLGTNPNFSDYLARLEFRIKRERV